MPNKLTSQPNSESQKPRKTHFYVFHRIQNGNDQYDVNNPPDLDRKLWRAFKWLQGVYRGNELVIHWYHTNNSNFYRDRNEFRLERLPGFAVAEEDILEVRSSRRNLSRWQKFGTLFGRGKVPFVAVDGGALQNIAGKDRGAEIRELLNEIHLRVMDKGIDAVQRKFLVERMAKGGKEAANLIVKGAQKGAW